MNFGHRALHLWFAAALMLELTGCTHTAQRVTELLPNPQRKAATQFKIARLQERQGNLQQAFELYGELYQHDKTNAEVAHRLGVVLTRMDRHESAIEFFRHAESLAPNNAELLSDLGYALYLQGDYEAAEAVLRRAQRLRPTDPRVLNNLALAVGHSGKLDEAFALFRKAGSDAEAYSNMAYIHVQRGEGEQAIAMFNKALTLDPKHKPAAAALIQLAELKRRSDVHSSPEMTRETLVAGPTPIASPSVQRQELATTASTIPAAPTAVETAPAPPSTPPVTNNVEKSVAQTAASPPVQPPWLQEFDDPTSPMEAVALGETDATETGQHPVIWSSESSDAMTAESAEILNRPTYSVQQTGSEGQQDKRAIPIPTQARPEAGATGPHSEVHAVAEELQRSESNASGFLRPVLRAKVQIDAGSDGR